jgi:transposase
MHAMVGAQLGEDAATTEVLVGIETDRGPWVAALVAGGYMVYAVNPLQAARFRDRHSVSGAKSDAADAQLLAHMVAPMPTSCVRSPRMVPKRKR